MENTTPPPNAPSVYSPYFSSEKELLKDVAKAETRIDNHDKEIEALKKKCGQLGEEISKLNPDPRLAQESRSKRFLTRALGWAFVCQRACGAVE